jgi:arsenate reductase-like glutaredoxin family protein
MPEETMNDDVQESHEPSVEELKAQFDALREEHEKTKVYLNKANKEAKERRLALKELEEHGLTIEEAVTLKKRLEEEERERAVKKGDVEKIREQLTTSFEKERKELLTKVDRMQKSLYENLVSAKANEAISEAGGVPKLLMPFIQKFAQVQEEDGKYAVRILDDDGEVRFNTKGDYMTIHDYVEELKSDEVFGRAFEVNVRSGSGSKSGGSGGKPPAVPQSRSKMSVQQKIEYIGQFGQDAFLNLPA